MQLIEKSKVYFQLPVFKDIGDEEALKQEKELEVAMELADMRINGFVPGALVVSHTCKFKHEPMNWGVILRVNEKWPNTTNGVFAPMEVRWFNAGAHSNARFAPEDVFLIHEGPDDEVLKALQEYNVDTRNIFK